MIQTAALAEKPSVTAASSKRPPAVALSRLRRTMKKVYASLVGLRIFF
jgi:hypothetical protein